MKKLLMFVASAAIAIALTGCGCSKNNSGDAEKAAVGGAGSAKDAAETFANAVIRREYDRAMEGCACAFNAESQEQEKAEGKNLERKIRNLAVNDDTLEGKAIWEVIQEGQYRIVDGKKYKDQSVVTVQFLKGSDKTPNGLKVTLRSVDGSWKVTDCARVGGLDTSDGSDGKTQEASSAGNASAGNASAGNASAGSGDNEYVREFEKLYRESADAARKAGETVSESDIQKSIEEFKKLSPNDQKTQLDAFKKMVEQMRTAGN